MSYLTIQIFAIPAQIFFQIAQKNNFMCKLKNILLGLLLQLWLSYN